MNEKNIDYAELSSVFGVQCIVFNSMYKGVKPFMLDVRIKLHQLKDEIFFCICFKKCDLALSLRRSVYFLLIKPAQILNIFLCSFVSQSLTVNQHTSQELQRITEWGCFIYLRADGKKRRLWGYVEYITFDLRVKRSTLSFSVEGILSVACSTKQQISGRRVKLPSYKWITKRTVYVGLKV